MYRSGKYQFLFWSFFFAVFIYMWIVGIGLYTLFTNGNSLQLPIKVINLLFLLYGILIVISLAGLLVAIMINNKKYSKRFSGLIFLIFGTIVGAKAIFG